MEIWGQDLQYNRLPPHGAFLIFYRRTDGWWERVSRSITDDELIKANGKFIFDPFNEESYDHSKMIVGATPAGVSPDGSKGTSKQVSEGWTSVIEFELMKPTTYIPTTSENVMTSKAYTKDEVVDIFLHHCAEIAHYWATLDRCNGVVFSILNIFDGTSMALPAIDLVLRPHPEDKQYSQHDGTKWFKNGEAFNEGHLHSIYHKYERKNPPPSPYLEALKKVKHLVLMSSWKHSGDDAHSKGMDAGARHQIDVILQSLDREISEVQK